MKKAITLLIGTFIFLLVTLSVFAQNSLVPIEINVGGQRYTFYNSKDVSTQIELREVKISRNNSEIKYINAKKIQVIKEDKSILPFLFNEDVKEYNRQVNVLENENKRYRDEISKLNRVLRKFK